MKGIDKNERGGRKMKDIPYVAFGNDEIDNSPILGETITCRICGKEHSVEYGDRINDDGSTTPTKSLAFFKCGDKSYLCGVNGKDIRRGLKIK